MKQSKAKHRFKSIDGAVRRIRELEKIVASHRRLLDQFDGHRNLLARLAAKGPAFFNPLDAAAAEGLRDDLLRAQGLLPDGRIIAKPGGGA